MNLSQDDTGRQVCPSDMFNPWTFYEEGRALEQRGAWQEAIVAYQKSLTCIPGILGVQDWFQRYLLDGRLPAQTPHDRVAALYARMGRCYAAMEQWDETSLYVTASLKWDQFNPTARRMMGEHPVLAAIGSAQPPVPSRISPHQSLYAADFLRDRLTLLIVTHMTNKLVHYKELSPPSVRLISATYGSMRSVFGDELAVCPKVVCFDRPLQPSDDGAVYQQALDQFCRRHAFEFIVFNGDGLRAILEQMVPCVGTPYLMIVEHDWFFCGARIQLSGLLTILDHTPAVNVIRFNQRTNAIARYDFLIEKEPASQGMPLLRTVAHSNNPSIVRTSKLRDEWLPVCLNDPFYARRDLRATAYGIEEPLFKMHIQDVHAAGFQKAHERWGTYLFGQIGDAARIIHLGE